MMSEEKIYPTTKEIIYLLGMGTLLAGAFLIPDLGIIAKSIDKHQSKSKYQKAQKEWKKFNQPLLRRNIKRLHQNKIIEIIEIDGQEVIRLTNKGKTKYLKLKLEEISDQSQRWDGKWRLVIYNISKFKKRSQENFRKVLKQIKFYPLQRSVYLTPYPCNEEIIYLREYFKISENVLLLELNKIENEEYFKGFFGL